MSFPATGLYKSSYLIGLANISSLVCEKILCQESQNYFGCQAAITKAMSPCQQLILVLKVIYCGIIFLAYMLKTRIVNQRKWWPHGLARPVLTFITSPQWASFSPVSKFWCLRKENASIVHCILLCDMITSGSSMSSTIAPRTAHARRPY